MRARPEELDMKRGLSRDEDTALRCLAALRDRGLMNEKREELLEDLRGRDRRAEIREEGAHIPETHTT